MSQGVRSAVTLSVLGLLLVVAAIWGWSATMKPLPAKVDTPICVQEDIPAGTKVFPEDVTVSVYNAGTREGLAGRTMALFTDSGFNEGNGGNVKPEEPVHGSAIWTDDPTSPAVLLVASRLGPEVDIERHDPPGVGVVVVVGDDFKDLVKGRRAVASDEDSEICSPPVS
jgi:LytR cell envelope-related transcriptional attenuator